ncbi:glycoside hydrolase family protein [Shewanella sp. MM_2022_3]|uniref:glycoside hydrolase family protein n=1 Tax=Shewanella sp. MM_2022_3 TaxID=2923280 RepID=UPI001F4BF81D|nr:glycoside hydrolase family protein [Shewanella sp. MM_2022_3]MCH7421474.1 glycoside hydrolase family protein [Shewanella sp. MM_2022_3]
MDLKEIIKENEGSIKYQQHIGTFKDSMFYRYKCSEGYWTIGYGHRCSDDQKPIDVSTADALLDADIEIAQKMAAKIHVDSNHLVNDVLTEAVFQIGYSGLCKFKKMIAALKSGDYKEAAVQMKDSKWYRQTPNRVEKHLDVLNNINKESIWEHL